MREGSARRLDLCRVASGHLRIAQAGLARVLYARVGDVASEEHPLRQTQRPGFESGSGALRTVDLFAGCGGLTLGAALAAQRLGRALDVRLAVDAETPATSVYSENFPKAADVRTAGIESLFSPVDTPDRTKDEVELADAVGSVDVLMGGPPCQGHSNLNNHTRRNDPKNALYLYMVRAAKIFEPSIVLIENVPAVLHDSFNDANVVQVARAGLAQLGYLVADAVVRLVDFGVPQRRKRHILLATTSDFEGSPTEIFNAFEKQEVRAERDLRWAIGDLNHSLGIGFDAPPKASAANLERMQHLIEEGAYDLPNHLRPQCHQGEHSYTSMYGRLSWTLPAQTITSGFGSIGQGRYMHPEQKRALTPHEAARLQGFPDYFSFSSVTKRADLATMIGNAVPPQLAELILCRALAAASRTDDEQSV